MGKPCKITMASMKNLILKVERPAYGGLSIGRHEGKIVMIKGAALPGETVEAAVEGEKKDYLTASVKKVLEPAPYRIEPACRYFGTCGGCHLQHIDYEHQLKLKQEILGDSLKRLAKTVTELSTPLFDGGPWNYRLRGQFKVSHGQAGFYRGNTREVVDIDYCPLMTEEINEYFSKAKPLLKKNPDVREIHITTGDCSTALIRLSSRVKSASAMNKPASSLTDVGFAGLYVETHDNKISRHGRTYVTLRLDNMSYTVSPPTFFQSHWRLNQKVVKFIKDSLQPLKGKRVLDLYSGAGNFSLPLASDAEVVAVEENPHAIEDGRRNAEINKIETCRFIKSSAEDFNAAGRFDIVILDPPRTGISNSVMEKLSALIPERIVYISCNPATFARDLRELHKAYDIGSVRMIDLFPQTFHIESLALLRLR
ncbi:MAG: class I SAM-dependent RNA methyltransferase [Nitrospiraceae bacterium]|nr:MAG: class I SAM-dependent RNA methyltransferase [Nitrospiraceae bacterium]